MGSLVGGWDARRPGVAPKGFEDYKEPVSPRSFARKSATPFADSSQHSVDVDAGKGSPPSLARTSAPAVHGASTIKQYLTRASGSSGTGAVPASPRAPGSPRGARSGPKHFTLMMGDGEEADQPLQAKEKWCSRVESAALNLRPDADDPSAWKMGSFKMDDPAHCMHLPSSPRAAAAAMAAGEFVAPVTPPAAPAGAAAEQRVTVDRLPQAAAESFDCAGL